MPITLVLDNARYQRCRVVQELARELRIELLFLPAYSLDRTAVEIREKVSSELAPSRVVRLFPPSNRPLP